MVVFAVGVLAAYLLYRRFSSARGSKPASTRQTDELGHVVTRSSTSERGPLQRGRGQ